MQRSFYTTTFVTTSVLGPLMDSSATFTVTNPQGPGQDQPPLPTPPPTGAPDSGTAADRLARLRKSIGDDTFRTPTAPRSLLVPPPKHKEPPVLQAPLPVFYWCFGTQGPSARFVTFKSIALRRLGLTVLLIRQPMTEGRARAPPRRPVSPIPPALARHASVTGSHLFSFPPITTSNLQGIHVCKIKKTGKIEANL